MDTVAVTDNNGKVGIMTTTTPTPRDRADLLSTVAKHRYFLRVTVDGLTDEHVVVNREQ